jgi:hypothetical protein
MKFYELLKVFSEMDKEAHLFARRPDNLYTRLELRGGEVFLNHIEGIPKAMEPYREVWTSTKMFHNSWFFTEGWYISEENKPCIEDRVYSRVDDKEVLAAYDLDWVTRGEVL